MSWVVAWGTKDWCAREFRSQLPNGAVIAALALLSPSSRRYIHDVMHSRISRAECHWRTAVPSGSIRIASLSLTGRQMKLTQSLPCRSRRSPESWSGRRTTTTNALTTNASRPDQWFSLSLLGRLSRTRRLVSSLCQNVTTGCEMTPIVLRISRVWLRPRRRNMERLGTRPLVDSRDLPVGIETVRDRPSLPALRDEVHKDQRVSAARNFAA